MTGTAPASAQRQDGDTLGGVPGAPAPARAAALVARAVTGADSAPVTMTAPFTGKPIIALPQATDPEVRAAFDDARAAQQAWAATAVDERQRILVRLQDLVLDRQREGLDLVQVETGSR